MSVRNEKVDPRNDYYKFKNQEWLKNNPIPDDKNRWGQFNILAENNKKRVKKLVENSLKSDDDQFKKIGILYNQGLDEKSRNTDEYKTFLKKIDNIKDKNDLMGFMYESAILYQFISPLDLSSYSDFSDSKNNILHIFTSGLILPDRDYYFLESKENIRQKFKVFIKNYTKLFNVDVNVENVFNFLKVLAKHTYTKN